MSLARGPVCHPGPAWDDIGFTFRFSLRRVHVHILSFTNVNTCIDTQLTPSNIYIYIYVCMYVCMYVYIRMYVCMYIVYVYLCMYTLYVHVYIYVHIHHLTPPDAQALLRQLTSHGGLVASACGANK